MNPSPNRDIQVDTYQGERIPNWIDRDPSPSLVALMQRSPSYRLFLASTTRLGSPTGRYNCHGLVFGSRRTNIDSPNLPVDIDSILRSDQYRPVQPPPQIGDVVVYRDESRRIHHTGIVSCVDRIGTQLVVWVWSMWGSIGEFLHRETSLPFDYELKREYWRLP